MFVSGGDSNGSVVNTVQWTVEPTLTEPAGESESLYFTEAQKNEHVALPSKNPSRIRVYRIGRERHSSESLLYFARHKSTST